jgi:phage protein D
LIDTKVTENWLNHTASDIARQLARRHDLAAKITPTQGKIGSTLAHNTVSLPSQSEWDLLTRLASLYQYQVSVQGHTLHFAPPQEKAPPYVLRWQRPSEAGHPPQFPGRALQLTRHLTVAKNVTVIVQSCLPHHKRSLTVQYPTQQATGTIRPGQAKPHRQVYRYTLPNQTREQALRFAQAKHREITQQERRLSTVLPADAALSTRCFIRLDGTGTDFDQLYYPESVVRSLDINEGYQMHVQAKNTSAEQTAWR